MFFKVDLLYYDEIDYKPHNVLAFVGADSYADVCNELEHYYGKAIEKLTIEPLAPDCVLEFNKEDQKQKQTFERAAKYIAEHACW